MRWGQTNKGVHIVLLCPVRFQDQANIHLLQIARLNKLIEVLGPYSFVVSYRIVGKASK